jgi:diacylglycerol kinase (ATP)
MPLAYLTLAPLATQNSSPLFSRRRAAFVCRAPSMSAATSLPRKVAAATRLARVDVIFNPVSGTGDADAQLSALTATLSRGYERVVIHQTSREVGAGELARAALHDGAQIVVASGGDGTVTAVAEALREVPVEGPAVRLGVVPRGTANALSVALGIPGDVDSAAALINRAVPRLVDVARVNGSADMMLLCGIGLEAETVKRADRGLKNSFGQLAYLLAGITSIQKQTTFTVDATLYDVSEKRQFGGGTVSSDVVRMTDVRVKAVTIANAAPPASVLAQGIGEVMCDDGLLEFVLVSPKPGALALVIALINILQSALLRKRVARSDVYGMRARRVELRCNPPQSIVIDGEHAGMTPIVIELDPDPKKRQIEIIAPKAGSMNRRRRKLSRSLTRLWRNVRGVAVLAASVYTIRMLVRSQSEHGEQNTDANSMG